MAGLGNSYPRQITTYGSTRFPHALGIVSQFATCGVVSFVTDAGDFWIYLDGTDPKTPMFGGYAEIMTNPGGGVALGTAVAKTPLILGRGDAVSIFGSRRVSASANVISDDKPALGLMWGSGANVSYLFVKGSVGELRIGSEAEWQAGTGTLLATKAPSGKADPRRSGRGVIGGNDRPIAMRAAAVVSAGRGAAFVLSSGDQDSAVAFYTSDGVSLTTSTYNVWRTWNAS